MVLDAALALCASEGLSAASMAGIAGRAGVAKSVLYDCFPGGQAELWTELLDRVGQDLIAHVVVSLLPHSGEPLDDVLAAGLEGFLAYADQHGELFDLAFGDTATSAPIAQAASHVREQVVVRFRDYFVGSLGLDRHDAVGAELFARLLVGTGEELARWTRRQPKLDRAALTALAGRWLAAGVTQHVPHADPLPQSPL